MARIVLDFDEKSTKRLDDLKGKLDYKSRTDVVRHALVLLDLVKDKEADDQILQFRKGNTVTEIAII